MSVERQPRTASMPLEEEDDHVVWAERTQRIRRRRCKILGGVPMINEWQLTTMLDGRRCTHVYIRAKSCLVLVSKLHLLLCPFQIKKSLCKKLSKEIRL
jgi:hypothetical protein